MGLREYPILTTRDGDQQEFGVFSRGVGNIMEGLLLRREKNEGSLPKFLILFPLVQDQTTSDQQKNLFDLRVTMR
jgi:hypothetical protein